MLSSVFLSPQALNFFRINPHLVKNKLQGEAAVRRDMPRLNATSQNLCSSDVHASLEKNGFLPLRSCPFRPNCTCALSLEKECFACPYPFTLRRVAHTAGWWRITSDGALVTALVAVTGVKDPKPEEIQASDAGDGSVVAANAESKMEGTRVIIDDGRGLAQFDHPFASALRAGRFSFWRCSVSFPRSRCC